jgi:hypothetical protein
VRRRSSIGRVRFSTIIDDQQVNSASTCSGNPIQGDGCSSPSRFATIEALLKTYLVDRIQQELAAEKDSARR